MMLKKYIWSAVVCWAVNCACSQLSAQTLMLKFGFGDSGTTTTDSVSGVVLSLLDNNNAAADLHGAAGTGPGGSGQSLNLSGPSSYGTNGPIASSYGGNGINLGNITNFTVTFWIKPTVTLYDNSFRRFIIIGTNGVLDGSVGNSFQILNNANREPGTSIEATINTAATDVANFGSFPLPLNQWSFLALTYDGTNLNYYAGSEGFPALLQSRTNSLVSQAVYLGNNWNIFLGNRANGQRPFQGYMADVRFYTGAGSASFIDSVRTSAIPPSYASTLSFRLGSIDASDSIAVTGSYVAPSSPVNIIITSLNYGCNSGTYKLITGASGISTNSYVLAATNMPPGFSGTLSASNGTLFVTMVASPWSQTSALGVPGTNGSPLSYQISLVSNATNYAASNLPPGLSLNSSNGLISGTPTNTGIVWSSISATSASGTGSSQLVFLLTPGATGSLVSSNKNPLIITNTGTNSVVQPYLDNTILINPGKGYVEYYGPGIYTSSVIGAGYIRPNWSDVEPAEGQYDWSQVDTAMSNYAAYGLKLGLGIISTSCNYNPTQPTPPWVFQPGTNAQTAKIYTNGAIPMTLSDPCGSTNGIIIPTSWDDPVYLARLHDFITAFGLHYNGNTNIAFLDERDYGLWGEGNGGFSGATQASAEGTRTNYYKPYLDAFPNTQLLEDAWYVSVENWLVSQGTGTRRDGICSGTNDDGSNDGIPLLVSYPKHPIVMEYYGKPISVYRGGPANELLIYIMGGRPSYLQFNGDGLYPTLTNFYNMVGNLIGYHFVLQQATIPNAIYAGVPFPLTFAWLNDGVAPLLQPCSVAVAILDTNNNVLERQWLPASNPQGWGSGVTTTESFTNIAFPSVHSLQSGKLAVGLFSSQTAANPNYKLGIQGRTTNGWYILGSVSLSAVSPPAVPTNLVATSGNAQVVASWNAVSGATGYYLKRLNTNSGLYTVIAGNLNGLAYTNSGLTNGVMYYFAVSATNSAGESANSTSASARPVSSAVTNITATVTGNVLNLIWPADHTGWRLLVQTNNRVAGVSINSNDWATVSGSTVLNQTNIPIQLDQPAEFYRLVYP